MADPKIARRSLSHGKSGAAVSLHSNLHSDVQLSLNRSNSTRSTWRESVNGLARHMLLKAKDGIDTLRGAPELPCQPLSDGSAPSQHTHAKSPTPSDFSTCSMRHVPRPDATEGPRASLSLRRILTNSSRNSKRSPLLLNLMSKRSMNKIRGPEEYVEDSSESSSVTSAAHASLRSLHLRNSSHSKASSGRSPQAVKPLGCSFEDGEQELPSSPINIKRSSPPPSIKLKIESGDLSPSDIFGFTVEVPPSDRSSSPVKPSSAATSGDQMAISRHRPKRQVLNHDAGYVPEGHVPRRSSNDHWRMRRLSRRKSPNLPDSRITEDKPSDLSSPMPGTNLPLHDAFDTHAPSSDLMQPLRARLDGNESTRELEVVPMLRSPSAGHVDPLTGLWASDDPVTPSFPIARTRVKIPRYNGVATATSPQRSPRDGRLSKMSIEELRSELSEDRKILNRLGSRMADIEDELRRVGSPVLDMGLSRAPNLSIATLPPLPKLVSDCQASTASSDSASDTVASPGFSGGTQQSPLEVQDLFYPSDLSDEGSTFPEATAHLRELRGIATNSSPSETTPSPTMRMADDPRPLPLNINTPQGKTMHPIRDFACRDINHTVMNGMLHSKNESPTLSTFESPDMGDEEQLKQQQYARACRYEEVFKRNWEPGSPNAHTPMTRVMSLRNVAQREGERDQNDVQTWLTKGDLLDGVEEDYPQQARSSSLQQLLDHSGEQGHVATDHYLQHDVESSQSASSMSNDLDTSPIWSRETPELIPLPLSTEDLTVSLPLATRGGRASGSQQVMQRRCNEPVGLLGSVEDSVLEEPDNENCMGLPPTRISQRYGTELGLD